MFNTILVATDGSDTSNRAFELSCDLAKRYGADLYAVHVRLRDCSCDALRKLVNVGTLTSLQCEALANYENDFRTSLVSDREVQAFGDILAPPDAVEVAGQRILDHAEKRAKEMGVKRIVPVLASGDAADAILAQAKKIDADLIVLGRNGLTDVSGPFLGGVAHKVATRASAACLISR
jgi:nucleotide-binding universal stress UspA family protein